MAKESNVCVEVVVGKVHQIISGGLLVKIRGTLSGAREGTVGGREGSFPHVSELIKEVGVLCLVCIVIHEGDNTLLRQNHLRKGRPLVQTHRNVWRLIEVVSQVGLLENVAVVSGLDEIAVDDQEGHDIVRMVANPGGDFVELAEISSGIEEVAACVATVNGAVHVVGLALNHADTIVELNSDRAVLVGCKVSSLVECGVVSDDLSDVAILAVAELGVVVARCSVGRLGTAAGACTSAAGRRGAGRVQVRAQSNGSVDDALSDDTSSTN